MLHQLAFAGTIPPGQFLDQPSAQPAIRSARSRNRAAAWRYDLNKWYTYQLARAGTAEQIAGIDAEYERLQSEGPDFTGYHTGSDFREPPAHSSRARIASEYSCSSMAFEIAKERTPAMGALRVNATGVLPTRACTHKPTAKCRVGCAAQRPLLGVKRTWRGLVSMSANAQDPECSWLKYSLLPPVDPNGGVTYIVPIQGMEFPFNRPMRADDSYRARWAVGV